jgi:hypothetical protein
MRDLNLINNSKKLLNSLTVKDIFFSENILNFVFQKTRRLALATHLLSGTFDDNEPLKTKLKSVATRIIEVVISVSDRMTNVQRTEVFNKLNLFCLETAVLLETAYVIGLVSELNFSIMENELKYLMITLRGFDGMNADRVNLSNFVLGPSNVENASLVRGGVKRSPIAERSAEGVTGLQKKTHISSKLHYKTDKNTSFDAHGQGNSVKKDARRGIILNFIKDKKRIKIKDIMFLMTDCSEKTVQRELSEMFNEALLSKEGERRWTEYFLSK